MGNMGGIIAYISVKLYKKDGGYLFIHKVCSTGEGWGSRLMNMILQHAKENYEKLGITYLSLTTHNLDLIKYYQQFSPTRIIEVNNPGSKAKQVKKVAYIIWQLSPNMPWLNYN
jgi:ribosomal protein S18 acetylase RimI-like enzyme